LSVLIKDTYSKGLKSSVARVAGLSLTDNCIEKAATWISNLLVDLLKHSRESRYLAVLAEMPIPPHYLDCDNSAEYRKGISFILNHKNENGSLSDYESIRAEIAQQAITRDSRRSLNTTQSCLWVLSSDQARLNYD